MKYNFSYSVGFMGSSSLRYTLNGDSASLPDPHNKTMESLANYDPQETAKSNPAAKDLTDYDLVLDTGQKKTELHFKEDNVPARFKSLIVYLRSKATLKT